MYTITLPVKLNERRYGLQFVNGVAQTENAELADRMMHKGFTVESDAKKPADKAAKGK